MPDREIHTYSSGGGAGIGVIGVVIGAVIVVAAIFFFTGGTTWFGGNGTHVTINSPKAPSLPSTTGAAPPR